MSIRQSDLKLLWGRSASRCAICRAELTFDPLHASASIPLGEQAHIVAKEPDGPRGQSILTSDERDAYDNLILLCPTHHTLIDKAVADYPVEKLHLLKSQHELWVQSQLSGDTVADVADRIYASLLDSFVVNCEAAQWVQWASRAIELEPIWSATLINGTTEFEVTVRKANFPGRHRDLERALQALALTLREARETFLRHAELDDEEDDFFPDRPSRRQYRGVKFYKQLREWNPKQYDKLFSEWRAWQNKSQALVFEATRAANWVAECARHSINPSFFAVEGKFHLVSTLLSDIPGDLWVPEYTKEERRNLPDSLPDRFANYRELFPFNLGPDD